MTVSSSVLLPPGGQRVLVVQAHPDDPDMTPERLASIREQEQRRAAETLGVQTVTFLDGYYDGEIEPTIALRKEIVFVVRQWKPDVVFTLDPWRKNEVHPDHRAVGICTVDALACARGRMYYPEQLRAGITAHTASQMYFFPTDRANHWVEISSVVEQKAAALRCHESQTKHMDVQAWISRRGVIAGAPHKMKCAESF